MITKKQAETLQRLIAAKVQAAVDDSWSGAGTPEEQEVSPIVLEAATISLQSYIESITNDGS